MDSDGDKIYKAPCVAGEAVQRPQPYRYVSARFTPIDNVFNIDNEDVELLANLRLTALEQQPPKRKPIWKTVRSYIPGTKWPILFVSGLAVQAVGCIVLECYIYVEYDASFTRTFEILGWNFTTRIVDLAMPAQFAVAIFESVYQVVLGLLAVRRRNTVQTVGVCVNNVSMCIMLGLGLLQLQGWYSLFAQGHKMQLPIEPAFAALLVVFFVETVLLGIVTWKLSADFAWAIYRHISAADPDLRKRYLRYELYIALLHLDTFFLLGFWTQSVLDSGSFAAHCIAAIAGLLLMPAQLILGIFAVERESSIGHGLAIAIMTVNLGLVGSVVQHIIIEWTGMRSAFVPFLVRVYLYAAVAIFALIATIIVAILCMRGFGKGLKPHLQRGRIPAGDEAITVRKDGTGGLLQLDDLKPQARMQIE